MQQEKFPNISTQQNFKPYSQQHLLQILAYVKFIHHQHLQNHQNNNNKHKKPTFDEKTFQKLSALTKQSAKIALKYPEQFLSILKQLIAFFMNTPHPHTITLITNLLGPDMKFQAITIAQETNTDKPTRVDDLPIIALPMVEQTIIALPDSSYCTTIVRHEVSDVGVQQNRQVNQQYCIKDEEKVVQYLDKPFKTVKRPGITDLFQNVADFIVTQFIERVVRDKTILNMHVDSLTAITKLLEYISTPLYTYYFLSLVRELTSLIYNCFSTCSKTNLQESTLSQDLCHKIKRAQYEELIYAVRSLGERWRDHKSDFNIQLWEWQMEQNMIVRFLQSSTSQKQLHSVKALIDRSRKVQYNSYSVLSQQDLIKFIETHQILEKIYKAQNHPQIIIKGKQLFEFMSKQNGLSHYLIDLIFQLIPKSNQNICKALNSTLQATGHTSLENNRQYIMTKISSLPRSNLFYTQTFTLIEALILLAPIQIISQSLKYVYQIIYHHYFGLKPQLKHKILNIYFEVYLMGVEEGQFDTDQHKMMIVLEPFLKEERQIFSKLTFLIIGKFLLKLKQHMPKKIGPKCKKIINQSIQTLFKKYKIHLKPPSISKIPHPNQFGQTQLNKQEKQLRQSQLGLVKQLLEASQIQLTKGFLSQKDLWQLIEEDSYFGRFLSYYSTESQMYLLEKLISKTQITQKDIKNIIESYYFMDKDVKDKIFVDIYHLFYTSKDPSIKDKLIEFVVKVNNCSASQIALKLQFQINKNTIELSLQRILSVLMQLKESLCQHDKQGYGSHPAFKYITNDYSLKLKILNMVDMFNPTNFQLQEKNYRTLYDVVKRLLPILGKSLKEIKLKIDKNDKYVTLEELKERLNSLSPYRQISLTVEESEECEWYDQSLLVNKNKEMNLEIVEILKQVFNHYCEQVNHQKRLFKEGACRIFERATNVETISLNDTRILHLFNNYSQTGQYLTIHQWVNFYYQSALLNPLLVISNLKNLGYGNAFETASQMIQNLTIETQNRFREYFAVNQKTYQSLFLLFDQLRQLHHNYKSTLQTQKSLSLSQAQQTVLIERISHLNLEIIKELPKWQKLQKEVLEKFISQSSKLQKHQINDNQKIVEEKQETEQLQLYQSIEPIEKMEIDSIGIAQINSVGKEQISSIQKVYLTGMILNHALDRIQATHSIRNVQTSSVNNGNSMQHEIPHNVTETLKRVQSYGINVINWLFGQFIHSQQNHQIDALNLTYNQNITILVLQTMGSLITRPLFSQMNKIKNSLKIEVSQLIPLSIPSLNQVQIKPLATYERQGKSTVQNVQIHISLKLQALSAINNDLIINYVSVLLYKLMEKEQLSVIHQLLQTFVLPERLLFSKQQSLGKVSNHLVYLLSDSISLIPQWYMSQILCQIKQNLFQEEKLTTVEYFKTLDQLLLIQTNPSALFELSHLIYQILQKASHQHKYADFFENKHHCQTIEGLLLSLKTLLNTSHLDASINTKISTLSQTLLTNFVLPQKSQSYLYQILSKVNQSNPIHNINFAYKTFTQLQLKKNSKLNTENLNESGIYNLGCICYINSVFQQLYHISSFSSYIMNTELKENQAQPYFIEFQKIIYNLKYSKRAFLITSKFCQNYTDYTGMPINIKQQHDADEFLNNLLDKLQKTYQKSYNLPKQKTIVNQEFKGSMSNVITCQNCFTHKPNLQEFYVLSLQIKNQSSLQECLDKMVEPEVICDYYCNTCDQKVDQIHKVRKFNSLPNILFIHFQRLVFDLETFTKIKLDHPVNFAQEIDLQNYFYTEQSHPCKYRLLGFIVHFGNSQGGHYISLIKGNQNNSWKKYDDSRITKWFWKTGIHQKDNAYLLIYQKVKEMDGTNSMNSERHTASQDISMKQSVSKDLFNIQESKIFQEITEDNILLGKQITVIRPDFGKFLISQLQKSQTSPNSIDNSQNGDFEEDLLKTKLIWKYMRIIDEAKTVGFSQSLPLKDNELQFLVMKFFQSNRAPQTAQHFLDISVEVQMVKSIYQSGEKKLRQMFSAMLANIVSMWNGYFSQSSYFIPVKDNETIRKLMWQIENGLSEVGKNYNKMDEYFEFILVLSHLVPRVKEYLKEMNIVAKLTHFMMHKDSKLTQKLPMYPMNAPSNKKVPCFNTIIQIIWLYLQQYPELVNSELVSISLGTKGYDFYMKMYEDRYDNYMKLSTILAKFCKGNCELSNRVIDDLILNKINRFSHDDFYIMAYIDLIYCILSIKDEHSLHRMYRVLGVPTLLIDISSEQDIMIKKKKQRLVGYWSNLIKSEDEMIIPFLQQLYNSKDDLNYFSLAGIVNLLQLIKENPSIKDYIANLPSPCLFYESYLSWINEFIKNSLKSVNQSKRLQKIDTKDTLNKISLLLEKIQPHTQTVNQIKIQEQASQSHSSEQINQQIQIQNHQNSNNSKLIGQNAQQNSYFMNHTQWKERNHSFLFGQIVEKSQTRLINQTVYQPSLQEQQNPHNQQQNSLKKQENPLKNQDNPPKTSFSIPITYCILKTVHIKDPIAFAETVLAIEDVIQPNEGFSNQLVKKQKTNQLLQNHLSNELDNSLIQISFSGQNQQLNPFKYKHYALKVKFMYNAYPYELLISVDKLINDQCKLIVPSPTWKIPDYLIQDCSMIDSVVSNSIQITLLPLRNSYISNHQDQMQQSHDNRLNTTSHSNKDKQNSNNNLGTIEEEYPSMDQVYGSDAYMQQAEQPYKPQTTPKEQVCIQCPFCGYIAHEFASRCPSCNQEWGYFA